MDERRTLAPISGSLSYGLIGTALFVVGGMMLENAMDSDWLTFAGLLAVGGGLLGIVAGGVSVGMHTRNRD